MMSEKFSIFQLGNDLVIAKDRAEAIVVWQEQTGEDFEDYYAHWDVMPAPKIIAITFIEHEPEYTKLPPGIEIETLPDGGFTVEASAEAWAKCYGRGVLAREDV